MRMWDIKLCVFYILVVSLGLMVGCNPSQLTGLDLDHNRNDGVNANAHCFGITRLTDTKFPETGPKVNIDKDGKVGVFWSFRGTMTPLVIGRYLVDEEEGWSRPERLASFVGSWDVAPSPDPEGGFLLIRSDWGNIFVSDLQDGREWVLTSEGGAGSPSITTVRARAYALWDRKISKGSFVIEGAIYQDGNWSAPIRILALPSGHRPTRLFILGRELADPLLVIEVKEIGEGKAAIHIARISDELRLETPLTEIYSSSIDFLSTGGVTGPDGAYWLTWAEGAPGKEQVYVVHIEGELWFEPQQISTEGERNISPVITADQEHVYIVWTSFSEMGEGKEYGRIIGKKCSSEGIWKKIEELYQESAFGRSPSIAADQEKIWLSWEWEGEIYALRLCN